MATPATVNVSALQLDIITRAVFDAVAYDLNHLAQVPTAAYTDITSIYADVATLDDRLKNHCLSSAGLRIKGGSASVTVQAHTAFYAMATGALVTKAADTDMAALSGSVTNAKFNVFCFYIDSAGTLTSAMGTEGASLAAVVFPATPAHKALIGFVVINPTGTGNFVGGTTQLDDGTVVPNAAFVSLTGGWDPRVAQSTQTITSPAVYTPLTQQVP